MLLFDSRMVAEALVFSRSGQRPIMPGGATYGAAADFNKFRDEDIRWVNVTTLQQWLASDRPVTLFDVRSREDYVGGTIPGATHLPQDEMFMDIMGKTPDIKVAAAAADWSELVLFANTGGVSGAAAGRELYVMNVLAEIGGVGVERMVRVEGGMHAWRAANFDISIPPKPAPATSLDSILNETDLSHLSEPFAGHSLDDLLESFRMGRTHLLDLLKDLGLKLPERQKVANAISRTAKLREATAKG